MTAVIALILAGGAWLILRYREESRRLDNMIAIVMSTPLDLEEEAEPDIWMSI